MICGINNLHEMLPGTPYGSQAGLCYPQKLCSLPSVSQNESNHWLRSQDDSNHWLTILSCCCLVPEKFHAPSRQRPVQV